MYKRNISPRRTVILEFHWWQLVPFICLLFVFRHQAYYGRCARTIQRTDCSRRTNVSSATNRLICELEFLHMLEPSNSAFRKNDIHIAIKHLILFAWYLEKVAKDRKIMQVFSAKLAYSTGFTNSDIKTCYKK